MQTIPEIYRPLMEDMIEMSRFTLLKDQLSICIFGSNENKTLNFMPMELSDKDMASAAAKAYAKLVKADFVIHIAEAWALHSENLGGIEKSEQLIAEYGFVEQCPQRVDCLMITLETPYGIWVASPLLKPLENSDGGRTFDEPTFTKCDNAQGRFTHLLPSLQDGDYLTLN